MASNVKKAADDLTVVVDELKALEAQFQKLEDLQAAAGKINRIVAKQLTGTLRSMLSANYSASGVGVISGDLKKAVENSYLRVSPKGLTCCMSAGFDKDVYVRASVFRKYRNFYRLSTAQKQELRDEFIRLWKLEAMKILKGK